MTFDRAELTPVIASSDDAARLEHAASAEFQFIWRSLRRLGVGPNHAVDDAAQRVFEIAARKRALIRAGCERAFFLKTAIFVAKETRLAARREYARFEHDDAVEKMRDPAPGPEWATEQRRFRERLDQLLDGLPFEFRVVFVLFELEELSSLEIATLLGVPTGTVASRLRRARELFQSAARSLANQGESSASQLKRSGGVR